MGLAGGLAPNERAWPLFFQKAGDGEPPLPHPPLWACPGGWGGPPDQTGAAPHGPAGGQSWPGACLRRTPCQWEGRVCEASQEQGRVLQPPALPLLAAPRAHGEDGQPQGPGGEAGHSQARHQAAPGGGGPRQWALLPGDWAAHQGGGGGGAGERGGGGGGEESAQVCGLHGPKVRYESFLYSSSS